jgi:alpha-L-rhamnosidase
MFTIETIQLDHQQTPIGLSFLPKLAWVLKSDKRAVAQTDYQIQLSKGSDFKEVLYDSLYVRSSQSINVELPSVTCEAFTKYFVRVRVKNNMGEETAWQTTYFVTGYVNNQCNASMITIENSSELNNEETFYTRKEFMANKEIESVYCVATAFGLYNLYFNGEQVGDYKLTPGWTSYKNNLMYQVYDVSEMVTKGNNTIGAIIGTGWYKGSLGFSRNANMYGEQAGFLCEVHINYADGSHDVIGTDETWMGHLSPILFSNIYDGEIYDARMAIPDWHRCGLATQNWAKVSSIAFDQSILRPQICEPVEVIAQFKPKELFKTPAGDSVLDFGQNMSGLVQMSAEGKKGDVIELNYFEALDKDGNVYLDNLRGAKQTIQYIFGDDESIVYLPSFTFQGFRYARIKTYPGTPKADDFVAMAISSGMESTGTIETSNTEVNQLMHNILWGLNGNFVDIPTDCPQRDERLGWTGDAQVFCRTASYLKNCYNFYKKYLTDLAFDQTDEGGVPHVVPDILTGNYDHDDFLSQGTDSAAGWADAAVIMPWTLYQVYGDEEILLAQYDSMKAWIDFMRQHSEDYIWSYKLQFGDWVALDAEEGSYFGATPNELMCASYSAYSTQLFIKIAKVLGNHKDVVFYSDYLDHIVSKYQSKFFDEKGHMTVQTQTAHIVSLYFELVPEGSKQMVADDLVRLLEKEDGHLVTGFLGTPYFCSALSQNGKVKEAYDLFLKDDFPSWLYQVKMGATTIWEHWDGVKPDGSMWSPDMNSFNHYAYGAIGEWVQRSVVGIEVDEQSPGYSHYFIQPLVDSRFSYVKGSLMTQFGEIKSHWALEDGNVKLSISVPVNTNCTIVLKQAKEIVESDITGAMVRNSNGLSIGVGSGKYNITFTV